MPLGDDDYLRAKEAAVLLHVSAATLAKWRVRRFGPAYIKVGRLVVYERSELSRWMASRRFDHSGDKRPA